MKAGDNSLPSHTLHVCCDGCSFYNISSYILGTNHFNKRDKQDTSIFFLVIQGKLVQGQMQAQNKTADLEVMSVCWLLHLQAEGFHSGSLCSELYNSVTWGYLCPHAPSQIQLHFCPYVSLNHHLITCMLNLFWAISNFSNYTKLFKAPSVLHSETVFLRFSITGEHHLHPPDSLMSMVVN